MNHIARFGVGLLLVLVVSAAAVTAFVMTLVTIKDAVHSGGSLPAFEGRIRHYSDRLESDKDDLRLIRTPHPFLLHFGILALSWTATVGAAIALHRVQRQK
jgi:hypothetical protein